MLLLLLLLLLVQKCLSSIEPFRILRTKMSVCQLPRFVPVFEETKPSREFMVIQSLPKLKPAIREKD